MLTQIDLQHFKCFSLLKLPLRELTLLSGPNASGKSTVLQALVLLHQTMREHEWSQRLLLNGATVRLGTVTDVIDQYHGRHSCEIALLDETGHIRWDFSGERNEMSMSVKHISISDNGDRMEEDKPEVLHHLLLPGWPFGGLLAERLSGLTYLTAERIGPREHYSFEDPQLTPVVGSRGEHAVSVLHSGRDEVVLKELAIKDSPPTRQRQVEARMNCFFPGCQLDIREVTNANTVTLGIRMSSGMYFLRPVHTGFGLTQVLPIVVAALSASPDGLLLIENPEVHLHPAGQAMMGEFLAEVAAAGVQVILETHSDHVLNGVRRAVKKKILSPGNIALHFFRPRQEDEQDTVAQVQSPVIDAEGNIDTWPEGFFDQFDKDMNYFAGWT